MMIRSYTMCPMDCPDSCGLVVEHDGKGRIFRIGGRQDHPDTRGFICTKVSRFARRQFHPLRLTQPLRRKGPPGSDAFEPISWDTAIAEIVSRLRHVRNTWGGEAIVGFHYGGSNGNLTDDGLDQLFFARLGASRLERTYCAATTGAVYKAMYGKIPGVAFADYIHARLIIIWGANTKTSNIHLVPYLKEAKKRGARIVHIDPVRRFSDDEIDLHLPIRPGTDLPLALCLVRYLKDSNAIHTDFLQKYTRGGERLLEAADSWPIRRAAQICDVPEKKIETLAHWYTTLRPSLIRIGWGLERNRNGGQAVAVILALPALKGDFGQRGSGFTLSNGYAIRFDERKFLGNVDWTTRSLNMSQIGRWLTSHEPDPPVRLVFIYNANPVVTAPNQNAVIKGLSRPDVFVVVHDQVMTDTARFADIVLPATTFLEHYDLKRGYGSMVVGGIRPILPPAGEACSNMELFARLGRAMNFHDDAFFQDPDALYQQAMDCLSIWNRPVDARRIVDGGIDGVLTASDRPILMKTMFPQTPDGMIHLCPEVLGPNPFVYHDPSDMGDSVAIFQLISPASPKTINSSLGEYDESTWCARMNPDSACDMGLNDGDRVRLRNQYGEIITFLRVDPRVRPGVILLPKGAWLSKSHNHRTANAVCPDHVNTVGGGACYFDARVACEKWE